MDEDYIDELDIINYAEKLGFYTEDGKTWFGPNSTKLYEAWELPRPYYLLDNYDMFERNGFGD